MCRHTNNSSHTSHNVSSRTTSFLVTAQIRLKHPILLRCQSAACWRECQDHRQQTRCQQWTSTRHVSQQTLFWQQIQIISRPSVCCTLLKSSSFAYRGVYFCNSWSVWSRKHKDGANVAMFPQQQINTVRRLAHKTRQADACCHLSSGNDAKGTLLSSRPKQ